MNCAEQLESMRRVHSKVMAELFESHNGILMELEENHAEAMKKLRERHTDVLMELEEDHHQEVQKLKGMIADMQARQCTCGKRARS